MKKFNYDFSDWGNVQIETDIKRNDMTIIYDSEKKTMEILFKEEIDETEHPLVYQIPHPLENTLYVQIKA